MHTFLKCEAHRQQDIYTPITASLLIRMGPTKRKPSTQMCIWTGVTFCKSSFPLSHNQPIVLYAYRPRLLPEWPNVGIYFVYHVSFDSCTHLMIPARHPRRRQGGKSVQSAGTVYTFQRLGLSDGSLDKRESDPKKGPMLCLD